MMRRSTAFALVQQTLEHLYRVEGSPSVDDFRTTAEVAQALGAGTEREVFLVHHDGEYTDLGLYVSDAAIEHAERCLRQVANGERIDSADVDGLSILVEGVSHFVYFTFCGLAHGRAVSRIELELQAEVDKFLVLRLFIPVEASFERLFQDFSLLPGLGPEAVERYAVASARAARYARWVERRMSCGQTAQALADARTLYRMPLTEKLDRIARAA